MNKAELNQTTGAIIAAAFRVSNTLGAGFLEKVYENALAYELRCSGLLVRQQWPVTVRYHGAIVGDYFVDLLVADTILVELKAAKSLSNINIAQCINYLRATGLGLCLLLNFGNPRCEVKRIAGPSQGMLVDREHDW